MPKFREDKEGLQKLLLSFDKDKQIPAGTLSPTKRGSSYDAMLVQVLLDVCCSFFAPNDPVKKNQLYTLLNESLYKDKIVAKYVFLHPNMKHASGWFMDYLRKICIDMGNPVNTIITSVPVMNFFTTVYLNTYELNFQEVDVIASGGFGTVCKAVHKIDKITYAVKKIAFFIDHKEEYSKVLKEVKSIASLRHHNIVSYKNCWVQLIDKATFDSLKQDEEEEETIPSINTTMDDTPGCAKGRQPTPKVQSDGISSSSQQLTPHCNRHAKEEFFTPTEESSESSSDSLENASDCIDQLDGLTSLSFHDDSDSSVQFANDDVEDESSLSTPSCSYASRRTDLDCSTPRHAKEEFFTPTEESSESSSDSLENASDCIDQLDGLTSLSFHDDSDSSVQFANGNQSMDSTVAFLGEEEETPGSALVTQSGSTGRRTPYREMSSKVKRKVTVENTKDSDEPRRPSVFERLGPGAGNIAAPPPERSSRSKPVEKCLQYLKTGVCNYGSGCRYKHESFSHTSSSRRSSKHEKDSETKESRRKSKSSKRDDPKETRTDSASPKRKSSKRSSSHSRKGDHEGKIKSTVVVSKPSNPDAPEPKGDGNWEDDSEDWPIDAAQLDYKEELTLERRRQQLQRELELELQKERLLNESVTITKTRLRAMLCIQMEYCDFDLSRWLEDRAAGKELPFQKEVWDIFYDIVKGVDHIHSNSIIHRDLKPANIFYSKRDCSMKIGDFGLATLSQFDTEHLRAVGLQPHTYNLGTFPYMAPEQQQRGDYDEKVDIYSLGIILLELLVPFKTRREFYENVTSARHGEFPPELTGTVYVDLVTNLLQTDPAQRMSAKEILQHQLLQDTAKVELLLSKNQSLVQELEQKKQELEQKKQELEAARKEIEDLRAQVQRLNSS